VSWKKKILLNLSFVKILNYNFNFLTIHRVYSYNPFSLGADWKALASIVSVTLTNIFSVLAECHRRNCSRLEALSMCMSQFQEKKTEEREIVHICRASTQVTISFDTWNCDFHFFLVHFAVGSWNFLNFMNQCLALLIFLCSAFAF
jgi:hypothetical protein